METVAVCGVLVVFGCPVIGLGAAVLMSGTTAPSRFFGALRSNWKLLLSLLGLGLAGLALAGIIDYRTHPASVDRDSLPPNIIFILADDLGYGDLGCYGQEMIKTPFLDQFAGEGVRFTNGYTGSPVCAPARYTLMTGRHMGHAYVRTMSSPDTPLRPEDLTVAEVLKSSGYTTGAVGKWGLGQHGSTGIPNKQGFDHFFGFLDHAEGDYYPRTLWREDSEVSISSGSYQQDLFTQDATKFIRRQREKPFFLYLNYMIPHAPYEIPSNKPYKDQPWHEEQKNYAAMVTRLDSDVGRIIALLKELEIDDNTIVFISSDNGPPSPEFFHSAGPLSGKKRTLDEGGIRIPMIARWPGKISAGRVVSEPVAFYDFLPTAAEIGGATFQERVDGLSILPVLLGEEHLSRQSLYWEFYIKNGHGFIQAVRMGRWKGIRTELWHAGGQRELLPFELYDLDADAGETLNLAESHSDIVIQMQTIMSREHEEPLIPQQRMD